MLCFSRGESFRKEFSQLGELRSLISEHVHVMAITATATRSTRKVIFKQLNMIQPKIIYVKPVKNNITYAVAEKYTISQVFSPIVKRLMKERKSMSRLIVFCKQCSEVAMIYRYFKRSLGDCFT